MLQCWLLSNIKFGSRKQLAYTATLTFWGWKDRQVVLSPDITVTSLSGLSRWKMHTQTHSIKLMFLPRQLAAEQMALQYEDSTINRSLSLVCLWGGRLTGDVGLCGKAPRIVRWLSHHALPEDSKETYDTGRWVGSHTGTLARHLSPCMPFIVGTIVGPCVGF